MAGTNLPGDEVLLEQALRLAIRDTLVSVPLIQQYAKVEMRERFPDNDQDDEDITTIPDPANPDDKVFTSIIQIGDPVVQEQAYTGDGCTQLNFTYPITHDMDVKDQWANQDNALEFTNSGDLFRAIYLRARRRFKTNPDGSSNRDLGYRNCVHDFLQRDSTAIIQDENESGKSMHIADWSLTIHVTGVLV